MCALVWAAYAPTRERLLSESGFAEDEILCDRRVADRHKQAFYAAVDEAHSMVVVAVRGTSTISDLMTNVRGHHAEFGTGFAHAGMTDGATALLADCYADVCRALAAPHRADYTIVFGGHSLGGGVAALAAALVAPLHPPGRVRCVGFGTPACATYGLAASMEGVVTTLCNWNDFAPRLSLASAAALLAEVGVCAAAAAAPRAGGGHGRSCMHVLTVACIAPPPPGTPPRRCRKTAARGRRSSTRTYASRSSGDCSAAWRVPLLTRAPRCLRPSRARHGNRQQQQQQQHHRRRSMCLKCVLAGWLLPSMKERVC
jgi:hypothetical protein